MNLPFGAHDPNAPVNSFRPERLVMSTPTPKNPNDFGPGESQFFVLPSCSNYKEFEANGWADYCIGAFYTRIRVKSFSDRFPQNLRVEHGNPLTEAYWKLYNALAVDGKVKGSPMEHIRSGFDAGGDTRCLLNIARNTHLGISGVLWFDVGAEKPGENKTGGNKRTLTRIVDALGKVYTETGKPGVSLEECALLALTVEFRGDIPQFNHCQAVSSANGPTIGNLLGAIADFSIEQLDEAKAWAAAYDDLPSLDQIPAIVENGRACEVLGISTNRAATVVSAPGVGPGFQAPPPQFQPQAPSTPQFQPQAPSTPQFQPQAPSTPQFQPQGAAEQAPAGPQTLQPPVAPPSASQASAGFAAALAAQRQNSPQEGAAGSADPTPAQF